MTKYDHLVIWSHPGKQWFWKVTHTVLSHSGVGQSDRITSKLASWPISPKWPFWGCPIWGTPDEILGFHVPAYGIRDVRSGVPQLGSWDFMSLRMESGMSDLGTPPGSSQLGHPPGSSQLGHSPGSSISMIYRFTMNIHTNHHKSPKITKNHPKSRFFTPQKHLFWGVPLLAKVAKSGTPR
jgi:hypothetical protein